MKVKGTAVYMPVKRNKEEVRRSYYNIFVTLAAISGFWEC